MGQADVLEVLQSNPGRWYNCNDLRELTDPNCRTLNKSLRKVYFWYLRTTKSGSSPLERDLRLVNNYQKFYYRWVNKATTE